MKMYIKLYDRPSEKILATVWSIGTYENYVILRNCVAKTAHIVNPVIKLIDDVRHYNISSRFFLQDYIAGTQKKTIKKNR